MPNFIVTYGSGHTDPSGRSLMHKYSLIEAGDVQRAREAVVRVRGTKWAFVYATPEEAGIERFGLEEVPLDRPAPFGLTACHDINALQQRIEDLILEQEVNETREDLMASVAVLSGLIVILFGEPVLDERTEGPGPWRLNPKPERDPEIDLEMIEKARFLVRGYVEKTKLELP